MMRRTDRDHASDPFTTGRTGGSVAHWPSSIGGVQWLATDRIVRSRYDSEVGLLPCMRLVRQGAEKTPYSGRQVNDAISPDHQPDPRR